MNKILLSISALFLTNTLFSMQYRLEHNNAVKKIFVQNVSPEIVQAISDKKKLGIHTISKPRTLVISITENKTVYVWDSKSGKKLAQIDHFKKADDRHKNNSHCKRELGELRIVQKKREDMLLQKKVQLQPWEKGRPYLFVKTKNSITLHPPHELANCNPIYAICEFDLIEEGEIVRSHVKDFLFEPELNNYTEMEDAYFTPKNTNSDPHFLKKNFTICGTNILLPLENFIMQLRKNKKYRDLIVNNIN